MKNNIWLIGFSVVLLGACSSAPREANDTFEYTDATTPEELAVPADLSKPVINKSLSVPEASPEGSIGQNVSILPPSLLIAAAEGSRVDEKDPKSTIWFEQTEEINDLEKQIWLTFENYYEKLGVQIVELNKETGYVETGWVPHKIVNGFWIWEQERIVESRRYAFNVKMKSHGRSGSVTVKLLERKAEGFTQESELLAEDEQRIATSGLNSVVGHFDYLLRLEAEQRRAEYAKGIEVSQRQLSNGDNVMVVHARFAHTWLRVLDAMNQLGVVITDINKLEGRIYGRINERHDGLWDLLFGTETQSDLELESGDYVVELMRNGSSETLVLINNNNLEPISLADLEKVLPAFAEIMKEDIE